MLIYTDGSNHDDTLTILAALQSGIKIDAIIITANGWGHASPSYMIFNNLTNAMGRGDIPIIMGALHAHRDYLENREGGEYPTGGMFNRAVERQFIVELDMLYGLAPELEQFKIPAPKYNPEYMNEIIEVLKGVKTVNILSLGAMTDVKYSIEWLISQGRRDDISAIYHIGAGYESPARMRPMDRSHGAGFNIYLDPDAAADCLELVPEKIVWLEVTSTGVAEYHESLLEPITRNSSPATRISAQLIKAIRENSLGGVPIDPVTGGIIVWDLTGLLMVLYPETITEIVEVPVRINHDSSVNVTSDQDDTTVCYRYNNDLARMTRDDTGYETKIILRSDTDLILRKYRELMTGRPGVVPGVAPRRPMKSKSSNIGLYVVLVLVLIVVAYWLTRRKSA